VENRLAELWSLFDFLMPGFFGALRGFQHRYAWPIERERDPDTLDLMRALKRAWDPANILNPGKIFSLP
jgi:SNF2 family DNA or RNA helicase